MKRLVAIALVLGLAPAGAGAQRWSPQQVRNATAAAATPGPTAQAGSQDDNATAAQPATARPNTDDDADRARGSVYLPAYRIHTPWADHPIVPSWQR